MNDTKNGVPKTLQDLKRMQDSKVVDTKIDPQINREGDSTHPENKTVSNRTTFSPSEREKQHADALNGLYEILDLKLVFASLFLRQVMLTRLKKGGFLSNITDVELYTTCPSRFDHQKDTVSVPFVLEKERGCMFFRGTIENILQFGQWVDSGEGLDGLFRRAKHLHKHGCLDFTPLGHPVGVFFQKNGIPVSELDGRATLYLRSEVYLKILDSGEIRQLDAA